MKRASSLRFRRPKPIGRSVGGARKVLDVDRHAQTSCCRGGFVLGGPAHGADDVLVARCSGRWHPRSQCGSPARSDPGSRRAAREPSSASPACRTRTGGRAARGSPAAPGRARRRPRATRRCGSRGPRHRREDRARLDRLAVHQHDAGAAVRRVAAPVGAGQAGRLADEVDEQLPRLDSRETCSPLIVIETFMIRPPDAGRARSRGAGRVG